ncbi:ERMES complex subunit [Saccharomycopsis crataegensis]|uniref:Mitochondrial distribution and morphology protein 12 n=1 Tax=Saccharomycopsis crataegensis TaxID=43959 RepID=A0AAV5QPD7_9ASCO|nr:ERMES complex subunit [Saccharomycopsis crataegensis]
MSLEINWNLLSSDDNLKDELRNFLDQQLQKIELPEFLKDVSVTEFNIGKIPPQVTLRHIGDPFDEFYEDSDEEDQNISGDSKEQQTPSISSKGNSERSDSKDLQMIAEIDYRGDLYVEISTNLLLNYPSESFIELPIKLKISDLVIHSLVILSYAKNLVNFSFLCDITDDNLDSFVNQKGSSSANTYNNTNATAPNTPISPGFSNNGRHNSNAGQPSFSSNVNPSRYTNKDRIDIIKDLKIDSEIGGGTLGNQSNGSVLMNVGKVEKFLVEKFRSILRDELAWPGWISFDLSNDDDDDDESYEDVS